MKKAVMEKLVKALRSGKFKQTKHRLKDEDGHCCLGVLCEISGKDKKEWQGWGSLPNNVKNWAGMNTSNGKLPWSHDDDASELDRSLVSLNDRYGADFDLIADIIQMTWEDL